MADTKTLRYAASTSAVSSNEVLCSHLIHLEIYTTNYLGLHAIFSPQRFAKMPVEPVGLAVGIAGILLAFKGVVDTVNLFDSIVSRDNGSRHLALKYEIERHRTTLWGDEYRAEDEEKSPLLKESRSTRILIAGILAEMRAAHELASKYVNRYDMDDSTVAPHEIDGSLTLGSGAVTNMKILRDARAQKSKFLWATKDKAKFLEIVSRLESLNNDLYSLVRSDNTEALANALSSYLLPRLESSLSLVALQQADTTLDPLLVLSARLKQLQNDPLGDVADKARLLTLGKDFRPDQDDAHGPRTFGTIELPEHESIARSSWVEWKSVKMDTKDDNAKEIMLRIKALATLLSAPKPTEFRIPPCVGLLTRDPKQTTAVNASVENFGFLYEWPTGTYDQTINPSTLLDMISSEKAEMPLLNQRFALAYSLASAMSMIHAIGWLHKAFRSDNILFFSQNGTSCITSPYITGFEYARPETQASLEVRPSEQPELNIYYHSDVPLKGFNRTRDIYSLGIVLFEIARWAPLCREIPEESGRTLEEMTPEEIRRWIEDSIPALGAQMGSAYRDAVETCIKGNVGGRNEDKDGDALARAFFARVLKRLSHCRV